MNPTAEDIHHRLDQLRLLASETDDPLAERLVRDLIVELEDMLRAQGALAERRKVDNEHDPGETDTKKLNNAKAWTSEEDERLGELIISNASVLDIAADLGRTVKAVRARAHALRIALGRSRFRVKAKAK